VNPLTTARRLVLRYGTTESVARVDARIVRIQRWGGHKLLRVRFWTDVWIALATMHRGRTRAH
jgi:hypothetical protein